MNDIQQAIMSQRLFLNRLRRGCVRIHEDELEKFCPHCKEYWPADTAFFYLSNRSADRLSCWCKACYAETDKRNNHRNNNHANEA